MRLFETRVFVRDGCERGSKSFSACPDFRCRFAYIGNTVLPTQFVKVCVTEHVASEKAVRRASERSLSVAFRTCQPIVRALPILKNSVSNRSARCSRFAVRLPQ